MADDPVALNADPAYAGVNPQLVFRHKRTIAECRLNRARRGIPGTEIGSPVGFDAKEGLANGVSAAKTSSHQNRKWRRDQTQYFILIEAVNLIGPTIFEVRKPFGIAVIGGQTPFPRGQANDQRACEDHN